MRKRITLWFCLAISTSLSFGQGASKLASDLESLLNNLLGPVNVIVQYNSTPGLVQQWELVALGGTITHQYSAIPAVSVTLPGAGIRGLLRDPLVSFISLDRQVAGTLDLTTAASGANYAFQAG